MLDAKQAAAGGQAGARPPGSGRSLERVDCELLNAPGGDPGLLLRLRGLRRSLLFDLGEHRLRGADLLEVSDVFLSHLHIDHFVGFDRLLRNLLGRSRRLRVFGPPGTIEGVHRKLRAYLWNLSFDDWVEFDLHELGPEGLRAAACSLRDRFESLTPLPVAQPSPWPPLGRSLDPERRDGGVQGTGPTVLLAEPGFRVEAAVVDHGTPSLAYALQESERFSFSPAGLEQAGITPGPELAALKRRILAGELSPETLAALGSLRPGRRIAYVTDCGFGPATVQAALAIAHGAERLYCEATFPDDEADKARQVGHLTGGQAGALARLAGAAQVVPTHFSRRHAGDPSRILADLARAQSGPGPWDELATSWLVEPPGAAALGPPLPQPSESGARTAPNPPPRGTR